MRVLLDTNVVLRIIVTSDPLHESVDTLVKDMLAQRNELCLAPQTIYEAWVVSTRPIAVNGLGFSTADAARAARSLLGSYPLLPDPPELLHRWIDLCEKHDVKGKPAHDARLVALMLARRVTRIVTLNPDDFARYRSITTITPTPGKPD